MTFNEIMKRLEKYGNETTKLDMMKHGAKEPLFGVKISTIKKIAHDLRRNHLLALELYESGNADAMYLAGLISEPLKMTKENLQDWVEYSSSPMISENTIAWTAAESNFGWELALEWIEFDNEAIASSGWATLSSLVSIKQNSVLDIAQLKDILLSIPTKIKKVQPRVKYTMNEFVIAVGSYIKELSNTALDVATQIGSISLKINGTTSKIPSASVNIKNAIKNGSHNQKLKTAFL